MIRFADTMVMSSYLVAFVVGRLEMTDTVDVDGIPLRLVHVPGKGHLADFGLGCLREDQVELRVQCGSIGFCAPEAGRGRRKGDGTGKRGGEAGARSQHNGAPDTLHRRGRGQRDAAAGPERVERRKGCKKASYRRCKEKGQAGRRRGQRRKEEGGRSR